MKAKLNLIKKTCSNFTDSIMISLGLFACGPMIFYLEQSPEMNPANKTAHGSRN